MSEKNASDRSGRHDEAGAGDGASPMRKKHPAPQAGTTTASENAARTKRLKSNEGTAVQNALNTETAALMKGREVSERELLAGTMSLMRSRDVAESERRETWVGLQTAQNFRLHQARLSGESPSAGGQEQAIYGFGAGFQKVDRIGAVKRVTAGPDFAPSCLFIRRVTACVGWAVHGLVFEFFNGTRMGYILSNKGIKLDLTDAMLVERGCDDFTHIEKGDYLTCIRGYRLATTTPYMCHSVTLDFASGRSISYESSHQPWKGAPFSFEIPQPCLVFKVPLGICNSRCAAHGLVTSIHLAITKENMELLPLKHKRAVLHVLWSLRRVDSDLRTVHGARSSIGDDVWWHVLGYLRGWHLEVENDVGKAARVSFNVLEQAGWSGHEVRESLKSFGWALEE